MDKQKKHKIAFVVPPGAHLLDFAGPAHIFYEAKDYGAPVDNIFINMLPDQTVKTSGGMMVSELKPFDQLVLGADDMIFIPGLEASLLLPESFEQEIASFLNWIKKQHGNNVTICSVCTGAYIPAMTGILNGKDATTHWKYLERFEQRFQIFML